MTIRKGESWGTVGPPPTTAALAHDNADVRRVVLAARSAATSIPPVRLAGGDLWRAIGGPTVRGRDGATEAASVEVPLLPVDVVRVEANGETSWFVAHLIARRSWWRGEVVAAVNSQYVGDWDVAPRGHPNDGFVDLLRVSPRMPIRDRWRARRRLPQGTHVPHPDIDVRRVAAATIELERPMPIWLDGERWLTAANFTLTVEPDAFIACV